MSLRLHLDKFRDVSEAKIPSLKKLIAQNKITLPNEKNE